MIKTELNEHGTKEKPDVIICIYNAAVFLIYTISGFYCSFKMYYPASCASFFCSGVFLSIFLFNLGVLTDNRRTINK